MQIVTTVAEARKVLKKLHKGRKTLGFVPTMGALHEGHLSLVRRSKKDHSITALSIFVNPTQFGVDEDLDTYPRRSEADRALCETEGVDLLFEPSPSEMYPVGYATYVLQERYTEPFEGEFRTGHLHGVCTICCKLFNVIGPDTAYFGQKDYQQGVAIRHMVQDLNMPMAIQVCPTARESDGLAMSSRNAYLSKDERRQATCLYKALYKAREIVAGGEHSVAPLLATMEQVIRESAPDAKIDYVAAANPDSLREVRRIETEAVLFVAVRLGKTRLIDNILISAPFSNA